VGNRRRNPFAKKPTQHENLNLIAETDDIEELDFWNPIEDVEEETEALENFQSKRAQTKESIEQDIQLFDTANDSKEDLFDDTYVDEDLDEDFDEDDMLDDDEDLLDDEEELLFGTKRRGIRPGIIIVSALIAAVVIVGSVYLYVSGQAHSEEEQAAIALREEEALRKEQQEKKSRYDSIMSGMTFLPGITVEGIDIGGMTKKEAENALQSLIESIAPKGKLQLNFGEQTFEFDLSLIQAESNLQTVLSDAMKIAQSEDMETALAKADEIATNGQNFTLTLQHDFATVTQFVTDLAAQANIPMKNASIGTIDAENHTVEMSEAVAGISIKETELVTLINNAILTNTLTPIQIPTESIEPTVTNEELRMIEISAETSFKGSSSSRIYNIKKGAGMINGKVLAPGEEFSANDILGVRTYKNGWKEANAYVGGTTEVQAGGGVCQLSSTLYNAVVKADLEVVTRRNHSMPVSYIKNGLDATINSVGNLIDFKFRNNTDCDLVVFSWTEGKALFFKIIRCAFPTDEFDEIRLTAEKVSTVYPDGEMEVIVDPMLPPGVEEIDVPTQNGSIYQSYKHYYKNGEKVRTEKLAKSTYKAFNGSKRVGPIPSPSPSLSPSPTPTQPPITVITPVPEVTTPSVVTPVPETPTIVPTTPVPATPEPVTPEPATPEPATPEIPVITEAPAATDAPTPIPEAPMG